ncbi:MAG: hypothetical protein V3V93_00355 [bacterium]
MSALDPMLVFVYNADSGLFEALKDGVTKIVSPASYQCRLCALTYGVATMKPRWRRFVDALGVPVKFLHRDGFKEKYPHEDAEFPSAYLDREGDLTLFISTEEMNSVKTLDELVGMVKTKLKEQGLGKHEQKTS